MHYNRLGVGIAIVNRLMYAIGGFNGKERLKSCECYHPENNEWTVIPPMNVGRSGAGRSKYPATCCTLAKHQSPPSTFHRQALPPSTSTSTWSVASMAHAS